MNLQMDIDPRRFTHVLQGLPSTSTQRTMGVQRGYEWPSYMGGGGSRHHLKGKHNQLPKNCLENDPLEVEYITGKGGYVRISPRETNPTQRNISRKYSKKNCVFFSFYILV